VASDRLVYKTALSLVTIATSGLVRLVFSLLIGRVFDKVVLGHVNVIVSAAVFATLLCSPGMGQSVARQLATRGLTIGGPEARFLLVRATAVHHALCVVVAAGVVLLVPARVGIEQVLAAALTIAYGCYTYYKAVLYGADLVRRYAVLELIWDGLFLASLITIVVIGATSWLLAPMVLVYGGFSVGAHHVMLPSRRRRATRSPSVSSVPRAAEATAVTSVASGTSAAVASESAPGMTFPSSAGDSGRSAASGAVAAAAPNPAAQYRDDRPWWRAVGGYALVTTLGTASSAGFLQLSLIFAARAAGDHGAGLFAAALSVVTPAYLLPRAISVVLFPAMARAAGRFDNRRVRRQLQVGTDVLAAALLPFFALAGVLATAVLTVAYGRGFADAGTTLAIMVWATWISVASVPAVNALSSDPGRGYLVPAGASLAGCLIGLAVWFTLGSTIEAVAWGYLVGSVVQSAVPMVEAARRHRSPRPSFAVRVVAAAAISLLVALSIGRPPIVVTIVVAVALTGAVCLAVLPELRSLTRMSHRVGVS
jgi:O-antigen/teichoic acid export membrane protein